MSWMCILGAAPFAALGFITYHGMTAEQFIWAWIRSELLEPKEIRFESSNFYYEALKDKIDTGGRGVQKARQKSKRSDTPPKNAENGVLPSLDKEADND